jgi:hypothetical protein
MYLCMYICVHIVGRDSVVGIATCYWLDGPGLESRLCEIFNSCRNRPWVPPSLAVQCVPGPFKGLILCVCPFEC